MKKRPAFISSLLRCQLLLASFAMMALSSYAQSNRVQDSLNNIYVSVKPANGCLIVDQGIYKAIFSASGHPLTAFSYTELEPGFDGYFIARKSNNIGVLIDSTGDVIIEWPNQLPDVDMVNRHYVTAEGGGQKTVYDSNGTELFKYSTDDSVRSGLVITHRRNSRTIVVMTIAGKEVLAGEYDNVQANRAMIIARKGDSAFVFDHGGRLLYRVPAEGTMVLGSSLVGIRTGGYWEIKDSNNKAIRPNKYYQVDLVGQGNFIKGDGDIFDTKGRLISNDKYSSVARQYNGWYRLNAYEKDGDEVRDRDMKLVIKAGEKTDLDFIGIRFIAVKTGYDDPEPRIYDCDRGRYVKWTGTEHVGDNVYSVRKKDKEEIRLLKGNKLLKLRGIRDVKWSEYNHFFIVQDNKDEPQERSDHGPLRLMTVSSRSGFHYGVVDSNLQVVLPMIYTQVQVLNSSIVTATDSMGRQSFFTSKGKVIAGFDGVSDIRTEGMMIRAVRGNKTVVMDALGNIVYQGSANPTLLYTAAKNTYRTAMPSLMLIEDSSGYAGVYNMKGEQLLPHEYYQVQTKAEGIFSLKKGDSVYFINARGKLLFDGKGFCTGQYHILKGYTALLKAADGKWGVIDAAGNTLLPFIYDTAGYVQSIGYFVSKDGRSALVKNTGELYFPLQNWRPVYSYQAVIVNADNGLRYSILNEEVQQIKPKRIEDLLKQLNPYNNAIIVIAPSGDSSMKPGIYNRRGVKIAEYVKDFNYGAYNEKIAIPDAGMKRMAVIDTNGKILVDYIPYPDMIALHDSAVTVIYKNGADMLFRYEQGSYKRYEIEIKKEDEAQWLGGGHAHVNWGRFYEFITKKKERGALSRTGNMLLRTDITEITQLGNLRRVLWAGKYGLWDEELSMIHPAQADSISFYKDVFVIWQNNRRGAYYQAQKHYVAPLYDHIYSMHNWGNELILVKKDGKFNLLNKKQETLLPWLDSISRKIPEIGNTAVYNNGKEMSLAYNADLTLRMDSGSNARVRKEDVNGRNYPIVIVKTGEQYGLYRNDSFRYILPLRYDIIKPLGNRHYFAAWQYKQDKFQGIDSTILVNAQGEVVYRWKGYRMPRLLEGQLWLVGDDGGSPVIDGEDKVIIPEGYKVSVLQGNGPDYLVVTKDARRGLYDLKGEAKTKMKYDALDGSSLSGGYIIAVQSFRSKDGAPEELARLLSPEAKVLTKAKYDEINNNEVYHERRADCFIVSRNNKFGVISLKGKELVPLKYDEIKGVYDNDIVIAKKGEKWGLVDLKKGKEKAAFIYDDLDLRSDEGLQYERDGKTGTLNVGDGSEVKAE